MKQRPLSIAAMILIDIGGERDAPAKTKGRLAVQLEWIDSDAMSKDTGISIEHITKSFERVYSPTLPGDKNLLKEIARILANKEITLLQKAQRLLEIKVNAETMQQPKGKENTENEVVYTVIKNIAYLFYAKDEWYTKKKGIAFLNNALGRTDATFSPEAFQLRNQARESWVQWLYSNN